MLMNRLLSITVPALVALLLVQLSACGFQLRGSVELPPVLKSTLLQAKDPWEGVAAALRVELESSGSRITTNADEATAILRLENERSQRRVLSVGRGGKASEYELFEEVTFSLQDNKGQVLLEPQTLRLTRDLVFDENQLLGKVSEIDELRKQMRRSLARQIITRIRTSLQAHEPAAP
ncbi:LPS-assembly lipoprotein [Thiogranum longum]|uniref:LPS-assembly lipoprotein LptE n=1 Tax=Thiogranum longum TaxID=1537524 RepID=A0A4V2PGN6_9GAMM|nr:LPS assembly lipoprotein LptE [Thiogranum longum]TCK17536.1 LPS-assembly lipoprotein [Thiogranum longum]